MNTTSTPTSTAPLTALERLQQAGLLDAELAGNVKRMQAHLARHDRRHLSEVEVAVALNFITREQSDNALLGDGSTDALRPLELPPRLLRQLEVMPLGVSSGILHVGSYVELTHGERGLLLEAAGMLDPSIRDVRDVPTDAARVKTFLQRLTSDSQALAHAIDALNDAPEKGGVGEVLTGMLQEAAQERASDIHLFQDDSILNCIAMYRIDGVLQLRHLFTPRSSAVLAARIKEMAHLDGQNRMVPQDGHLAYQMAGRQVDVRVGTLPTVGGEKLVMRLQDPAARPSLKAQTYDHPQLHARLMPYVNIGPKTAGLFLTTGPTGSGKTSMVNAMLALMPRHKLSLTSAEDPVEMRLPWVAQTNVSPLTGLGYPEIARAQMRVDPDLVVLGEIRDRETADMGLRIAESGHFCMGTLHASTAEDSVHRLLNLLAPEYRAVNEQLLATYLQAVVNVRLAPRMCRCAEPVKLRDWLPAAKESATLALGLDPDGQVLRPKGCARCNGTGVLGRVLVPEALFVPSDAGVRQELSKSLSGQGTWSLTHIEGIEYHSRADALRRLLLQGQVDAKSALIALGEHS